MKYIKLIYFSLSIILLLGAATHAAAITAEKITQDYKDNEMAADVKYKDNIIIIDGVVGSITQTSNGKLKVTLSVDLFETPTLIFLDTQKDKLMNIKRGDKITARCAGDGNGMMGPKLRSCIVETAP